MNAAAPSVTAPPLALVTGGAGGIGRAICHRLAAEGFRVAVADLDAGAAGQLAATLGPGHRGIGVDLTDAAAAAALPGRAADDLGGRLALIVNNAGLTDSSGHDLAAMPDAVFDRIVAVNLTAVTRICTRAPDVLAPGGTVVNIASGAAFRPLALRGPYSATKAAVVSLTRALAAPYRAAGLRIGAVAPGFTLTPMVQDLQAAGRLDLARVAATVPLARLGSPSDIADAVSLLSGPAGAALNGQTIVIDGGSGAGQAPVCGTVCGTARGTAPGGATLVLESDGARDGALTATPALAAVITRQGSGQGAGQAFDLGDDAGSVLRRVRDVSRLCAAHPGRTPDFALLILAAAGDPATGAGLGMLARTLALEWAPAGGRVNALIWHGPETAALDPLCAYLTGPRSSYVTGQVIEAGQQG